MTEISGFVACLSGYLQLGAAMTSNEQVEKARAAYEEAQSAPGKDAISVSHKLDELAAALKANGQLLEAANATAQAKLLRRATLGEQSEEQEKKFGSASQVDPQLSAVGWLRKLRRIALVACTVAFVLALIYPASTPNAVMIRDLIASAFAGTCLQLLLFPIKSLPRLTKFAIVAIGSGIVMAVLGR